MSSVPPANIARRSRSSSKNIATLKSWLAESDHLASDISSVQVQAQAQYRTIVQEASPLVARDPHANAPTLQWETLKGDSARLNGWISQLKQIDNRLAALTVKPSRINEIRNLSAQIRQNLSQGMSVASVVQNWVGGATTLMNRFKAIHQASPGILGVRVRNSDADWTVQGCEVTMAEPGTAAANMGLIGSQQRTDPVGDVITGITDVTDGNHHWVISNCQELTRAMQWTRPGDTVIVNYYYRQVIWYELNGTWVPRIGTAALDASNGPTCPLPITGTITSALTGNRIILNITLTGPKATQSGIQVILDTGGAEDYFPNALLRQLGFTPLQKTTVSGVVPGANSVAYLYHLPGDAFLVEDQGQLVPLANGTLTVWGIVNGSVEGLSPNILTHGAALSTSGNRWTLVPPCP